MGANADLNGALSPSGPLSLRSDAPQIDGECELSVSGEVDQHCCCRAVKQFECRRCTRNVHRVCRAFSRGRGAVALEQRAYGRKKLPEHVTST